MAAEWLLKTGKHSKYTSYRKILYHRFFVGLLLFIVVSLVFTIVFNEFSGSSTRIDVYQAVNLDATSVSAIRVSATSPEAAPRAENCTYSDCFDVYRCGRGGHEKITIYIYPLRDYQTENGNSISQLSKEFYLILDAIKRSKYYTPNPEEACILVPSLDTLNQHSFSSKHVSQVLQSSPQ